jgi:NADPH2:quinone reductase
MPSGIILKKTGPSNVLKIQNYESRSLNDNEIRIKIHFAGVNYADILARKGIYSWTPPKPYILGFEGSGEIIEVGNNVINETFKIGQKVIMGTQYGCYSDEIITNEKNIYPIIPQYSMEENAAFLVTWVTSFIGLCVLGEKHVKPNSLVLINSAAGGVGSTALQIAKTLGAKIIGTVGSDKKIKFLERLGVDQVINYNKTSIVKELGEKTIDFCLESVGGKVFKDSLKVLKPLGMLLTIGVSSVDFSIWRPLTWIKTYRGLPRTSVVKMIGENKIIGGYHIGRLMDLDYKIPWNDLVKFVTKNNLKPLIGKIFDLNEASSAHNFIESRQSIGKILLKCY